MRIIILTQEDSLYLPKPLAHVCRELGSEVVCIVSSPAMTTHGGAVKGLMKHMRLFRMKGSAVLATRVLRSKFISLLVRPQNGWPFHSISQVARTYGIPFHRVSRINSGRFAQLLDRYRPELLISLSCPQTIGKKVRERIPKGCINVHGAPLPKYRGLMPAFWVLRNGETRSAVTVHDLTGKLDDGDILVQREVEVTPDETWDSLVRKTKDIGAAALVEAVCRIKAGAVKRRPNPEGDATYFSFPNAADAKAFIAAGRRFFQ